MDDYYRLLGVSPDASRDEIREAYRARRDALGSETDEARSEAAQLNRAWNVLSDPVQRERYDADLASGRLAADNAEGEVTAASSTPPRRGLFVGGAARPAQPLPPPTIELPAGARFAETRARVLAMVIDLAVLILLGTLLQVSAMALIRDRYPEETDALDRLADRIEAADERAADAGDRADDADADAREADEAGDDEAAEEARAAARAAREEQDAAEAEADAARDEAEEIERDLQGVIYLAIAAPFVLGLAYLVVPSALTGQTLGKRLRKIRVIKVDGSPPGWSASAVRYGLPVLVVAFLWLLLALGPLAIMVALLGVLTWLRSPNQQGLHDRVAHTVVVASD